MKVKIPLWEYKSPLEDPDHSGSTGSVSVWGAVGSGGDGNLLEKHICALVLTPINEISSTSDSQNA